MIAIHNGTDGFHERWLAYCEINKISFKVVDMYSSNIINELAECEGVLWQHNHAFAKDQIMAKQLLFALEHGGKKVFPDFFTGWHFDDKLGQKYLFEALGIAAAKMDVFFSKEEALHWLNDQEFPLVFKLRRGAGSKNVQLVNSLNEATSLVNQAFGRGFRQIDAVGLLKDTIRKRKLGMTDYKAVLKSAAHLVYPYNVEKGLGRDKGYVYFQEFIPDNTFDIRVIVIGNKAFAIKRFVRENDFRASGSGYIGYAKELFDDSLIELSFEHARKLQSSCVGFDFVFKNGEPLVVEISYGFSANGYDSCPGYWTEDLDWHQGTFNPYGWMIEDLLLKITSKK